MSTIYDVLMKRHNGIDWDTIYPKTKAENIISGVLAAARIPSLDASKVTTGAFGVDRIPSLDAAKIASGVLATARIPNLDASKISSGTIDRARLPSIAMVDVFTDTTLANFVTNVYALDTQGVQEGDVIICTTEKKTYIHNGGTAGTAADFTLMETPTDVVTSVAGKIGVVTLVKGDVGLGNVQNVDQTNPANIVQSASYRFVTDTEKGVWNGKVDSLSDLGITVAAAKINFLANVGSDVQNQINAKQNNLVLATAAVLTGMGASAGDVAFEY